MHENYNANLGKMSGRDDWETIVVNHTATTKMQTRDADFRRGVPFMPIGNALEPTHFPVYSCAEYAEGGKLLDGNCVHSALWLGAIVADIRSSMNWIAIPGFENSSNAQNVYLPYSAQVGRFSREIAALQSTVGARFDAKRPTVTISDINPNFAFDYPVIRAGAWASVDDGCVTLVVVNNWQEKNVSFSARLGLPAAPGATVARRFVFAPGYNTTVWYPPLDDRGQLRDTISPGNAQIYAIGCT